MFKILTHRNTATAAKYATSTLPHKYYYTATKPYTRDTEITVSTYEDGVKDRVHAYHTHTLKKDWLGLLGRAKRKASTTAPTATAIGV